MTLFEGLERRRAEIERHNENSARLAQAFGRFQSTGQGSFEFPKRLRFELTFIEEPYVSYCSQVDLDGFADLLGIDVDNNDIPPLPSVTGFVTEWDQDDRGFYIGAWCAVNVYFPAVGTVIVPLDAQPVIDHHFTFTAIAMKDIPIDERD